jgi:hypothetical protein
MQSKRLAGLLVLVCALALSGCARLEFYTKPNLEGPETGVKFYYSKPYLLVARTPVPAKPATQGSPATPATTQVQVSIQYLPDLQNPVYAKLRSGYGSANLSLAFQNSMLTSVGQNTDTKIPETIAAATGMATAATGLRKAAAERLPSAPTAQGEKPDFTLYEIVFDKGTICLKEVKPYQ